MTIYGHENDEHVWKTINNNPKARRPWEFAFFSYIWSGIRQWRFMVQRYCTLQLALRLVVLFQAIFCKWCKVQWSHSHFWILFLRHFGNSKPTHFTGHFWRENVKFHLRPWSQPWLNLPVMQQRHCRSVNRLNGRTVETYRLHVMWKMMENVGDGWILLYVILYVVLVLMFHA